MMENGVDIAKIDRFEKEIDNPAFLNKYFTKNEIEYISKKSKKAQTLAGLFCAKEAILKAFGMGIGREISLRDISILHDDFGKPYVEINSKLNYYLMKKNSQQICVSISHDGEYAIAFCVIN